MYLQVLQTVDDYNFLRKKIKQKIVFNYCLPNSCWASYFIHLLPTDYLSHVSQICEMSIYSIAKNRTRDNSDQKGQGHSSIRPVLIKSVKLSFIGTLYALNNKDINIFSSETVKCLINDYLWCVIYNVW